MLTGETGQAKKLQQQLEQAVAQLQDEIVDAEGSSCCLQEQQQPIELTWRSKVYLQRVRSTGPGSRAYQAGKPAEQQPHAVLPLQDFSKGELIGMFLVSCAGRSRLCNALLYIA